MRKPSATAREPQLSALSRMKGHEGGGDVFGNPDALPGEPGAVREYP